MTTVRQLNVFEEEARMRFYSRQHRYYCGIDLHARTMYLCIIDQSGTVLVHRNMPTERGALLRAIDDAEANG